VGTKSPSIRSLFYTPLKEPHMTKVFFTALLLSVSLVTISAAQNSEEKIVERASPISMADAFEDSKTTDLENTLEDSVATALETPLAKKNILMKTQAYGSDGFKVGYTEDVLFEEDERFKSLIIDVGSRLGMGSYLVEIDASHLTLSANLDTINVDLTRDEMRDLPEFIPE
jgi:hypothetical protein